MSMIMIQISEGSFYLAQIRKTIKKRRQPKLLTSFLMTIFELIQTWQIVLREKR